MKTIYWHRKFISRYIILFLTIFMIVSLYIVEKNLVVETKGYGYKINAAKLADQAFKLTQEDFLSKGYLCRSVGDVSCTGLLGLSMTPVTTDSGDLYAKKSSINPNIAALFVSWLKELDLKEGDTVAIQETGSYPALDISMFAAIKSLNLKPLVIFSAGASQYGANRPKFTWLDIYHNLVDKGLFNYSVLGATLGGPRDNAYGMTPTSISYLDDAIKRNDYKVINVPYKNATNYSIEKRMKLYKAAAGNNKIKAYINVGGNMASIGLKKTVITKSKPKSKKKTTSEKKGDSTTTPNESSNYGADDYVSVGSFPSGVTKELPPEYKGINSVAVNFLKEGIPVVNIRNITTSIIGRYGLIYNPSYVESPGKGKVFSQKRYNRPLAVILLIVDILLVVGMAIISRKYLISFKRGR